jgi:hypothetical protein
MAHTSELSLVPIQLRQDYFGLNKKIELTSAVLDPFTSWLQGALIKTAHLSILLCGFI